MTKDEKTIKRYEDLRKAGYTCRAAAAKVGMPEATIRNWLTRAKRGLPFRTIGQRGPDKRERAKYRSGVGRLKRVMILAARHPFLYRNVR